MGPVLVLASASPARASTLRSAGVEPLVRVSGVDEDAVMARLLQKVGPNPTPEQIVCAEAEAKTESVARLCVSDLNQAGILQGSPRPQTDMYLVVGADSMLEIGGRMVGKPGTPEVARERILEMQNSDGVLWSGHCVIPIRREADAWVQGEPLVDAASTIVHFGSISPAEIDAYVATGEPLNVAGSFTIDGLGGPFIEGVTGDPHSVVGISLPLLKKLTDKAGVFWPDLWADKPGNEPPTVG